MRKTKILIIAYIIITITLMTIFTINGYNIKKEQTKKCEEKNLTYNPIYPDITCYDKNKQYNLSKWNK